MEFRFTGTLFGDLTGHRWLPSQRPVTQSFDVFFDLCLNKQLSKQSRRRWFETPSRSLWHHCNGNIRLPPETILKLNLKKYRSSSNNIHFSCLLVLKLYPEYNSISAVLWAKFKNNWGTEKYVIGKRDFSRFWFMMRFERIISYSVTAPSGPFYYHDLTLILVWINNYIHCKGWDEITYPFPNFNGATVEICEWISYFIPHFTEHVNPCWD